MSTKSLGFIETIGMAAAIEAADTALKSANVELIGYELTRGNGMVTIKIQGDVSAVKAAIDAAKFSAAKVNKVCAAWCIPRPSQNVYSIMCCKEKTKINDGEFNNLEETKDENLESLQEDTENDKDYSEEEPKEDTHENENVINDTESNIIEKDNLQNEEVKEENQICNICHDPLCTRKKGQPRNLCIHYNEEQR